MTTAPAQPRWGDQNRDKKAAAILQTLAHYTPANYLPQADCLDIGCGNGEIAFHLAAHVRTVTGVDPEPWPKWQHWREQRGNLTYLVESAMQLSRGAGTADVVVCNQVYEHVPDPLQLIREIHRVLKPGGYAYFAGPNLLFPIEPHVHWPFVHWLPRGLAVRLMRWAGSTAILDAYSTSYWRLQRWLTDFTVANAVPFILRHPGQYGRSHGLWQILSHVPHSVLDRLTWLSPGFVLVLHKPHPSRSDEPS